MHAPTISESRSGNEGKGKSLAKAKSADFKNEDVDVDSIDTSPATSMIVCDTDAGDRIPKRKLSECLSDGSGAGNDPRDWNVMMSKSRKKKARKKSKSHSSNNTSCSGSFSASSVSELG